MSYNISSEMKAIGISQAFSAAHLAPYETFLSGLVRIICNILRHFSGTSKNAGDKGVVLIIAAADFFIADGKYFLHCADISPPVCVDMSAMFGANFSSEHFAPGFFHLN